LPHPVDATEFREQLRSRKHTLHQLRMKLQSLPANDRFDSLLGLFTETCGADTYTDQEVAGRLLVDVMPECHRSLDDVLKSVSSTWNVSVEQLPYYLAEKFGRETVIDAATTMAKNLPSESRESRALDTITWWLRGCRDDNRTNNPLDVRTGNGL
jgi:hypothetical protein